MVRAMPRPQLLLALLVASCSDPSTGDPDHGSPPAPTDTDDPVDPPPGGMQEEEDVPDPVPLRVVNVDSMAGLRTAIDDAQPGDEIVVKDGNYSISGLAISKRATAEHPIVIRAETVGGVTISGSGGFRLSDAHYIIIRGFVFTHDAGSTGLNMESCQHVRITRNTFRLANEGGTSHWVSLGGSSSANNRIDRNLFENKNTVGNFIRIIGDPVSKGDVIDRNFFYRHKGADANGGEAVRVGGSVNSHDRAEARIERNLFEQCNGDPEAISIKSVGNVIRGNTLRDNEGSIVLRHGYENTVDGNFILGGQSGIRLYGHDQHIVNNYIEGTTGGGVRSALVIGTGNVANEPKNESHANYGEVRNSTIAFNTMVNNRTHLVVGYGDRSYEPRDSTIGYNIIQGDGGTLVSVTAETGTQWIQNILYGGASNGDIPGSGFTDVDPKLTTTAGELLHLGADSPALDAIPMSSVPSFVATDMEGQRRGAGGNADIGADERSADQVIARPLQRGDVGPEAK
jgi:poly(beta-D-mannuronate) lyase